MAQRAPIVLADGAATPVNHTFTPIGKPAGSEYDVYVERTLGRPDFQKEIRVRTVQPTRKGQPYRVLVTMLLPTTKTVDGVEELDFQNRVDVTLTCAPNGITQSREDLRVMLGGLLSNAQLVSVIDDLENLF